MCFHELKGSSFPRHPAETQDQCMQTAKESHTPVRGPGLLAKPSLARQGARLQKEGGEETILTLARIDGKRILRQVPSLDRQCWWQHRSLKEV